MEGKSDSQDFVLRFANVNGSGSASANNLIARCLFRMGQRIGPKNMFPSNIQGMPTWYEIRVNDQGFSGRKGGVDLLLAMNRQSLSQDILSINPNGFMMYDSGKFLDETSLPQHIHCLPVPISQLAREHFPDLPHKNLLENMIYVGLLCPLLNLNQQTLLQLVKELFINKPQLSSYNIKAVELGLRHAKKAFPIPLPFHIKHTESCVQNPKKNILIDGNSALALGCLYAGATVCSWYPITPSTSVITAFEKFCKTYREDKEGNKKYALVQAEDEIAALGMVLGAAWNGARSFTATSGPGISLMTELLGYAYYAEIPAVIFNIQRCGPSTGLPTRNQQADLLLCAYASHGDTRHIMLLPSNPEECFQFAVKSFDLAEQFQTPVFVMSDIEIGMNDYLSPELEWNDDFLPNRGKILHSQDLEELKDNFYRYKDYDQDGICYRTLPGTHPHGAYFTRGSGHDQYGRYTEDPDLYSENMLRIEKKFANLVKELPEAIIEEPSTTCTIGIISFGSTHEAMKESLTSIFRAGKEINHMRLRSFPFTKLVKDFINRHERIIVVEQNRDGQMKKLLEAELRLSKNLESICLFDGMPIRADHLTQQILSRLTV